jgi:hypothetical protein
MYDGGVELGKAIATHAGDGEATLFAYERDLFPRSASAAVEAHQTFEMRFGDNAPQSLLDLFTGQQPVE